MANNFYNHGSFPTTGSAATSASMRAELDSIAAGFDKMPTLTGNANEIVVVNPSATGLDSIPTLPATSGGTGLASYAVGDLVYASTTTALSKLADVATGNALISGGVGVAPSYGKIGLTTHVSGTLPVANGGTGITSFGTGVATALGINVGTAGAFVVNGGALGTPSSGTLTNATGLPVSTGISGLGSSVATALAVNVGSAGAFVVNGGALGTPSSGTVTNLTGTASININGTVGATTPTTGAFTTLTASGNTTLGDASTDTVTVNGYMGVGGAGAANKGIYQRNTALTGTTQYGITAEGTFNSAATGGGVGIASSFATEAAAFTMTNAIGFRAFNVTLGAGSAITNQYGLLVDDQTRGTNNFGVATSVSSGTNKWNIYASGTAQNYFAGNVGIGTSSPAEKLTVSGNASLSGNLTFTGTGNRITGDFSNATVANRVLFQTSTVNAGTRIDAIPNGTSLSASFTAYANSDPANTSTAVFATNGFDTRIQSSITGTGTYLPMTFYTGGSERLRIDTSGNVGIGTSSPSQRLDVVGSNVLVKSNASSGYGAFYANGATGNAAYYFFAINSTETSRIYSDAANYLGFATGNSGTERMRIDSAGNVGIGTSSPSAPLDVNGNVAITGSARRITGDFSNATVANRVIFQTSSAGSNSVISAIPNGAATQASFVAAGNSDPTNASIIQMLANGTTDTRLVSTYFGTGTFLPMTFYTGGSERMRISPTGTGLVSVGRTGGFTGSETFTANGFSTFGSDSAPQVLIGNTGVGFGVLGTYSNHVLEFRTNNSGRMYIETSGNVGIGTSSPGAKLDVRGSSTFLVNATNPTAWISVDSALTTGSMYNQWNTSSNIGISGTYTNHAYTFVTNNTERMRIDTSGKMLIGSTNSAGGLLKVQTATDICLSVENATVVSGSLTLSTINNAATANIPLDFRASAIYASSGIGTTASAANAFFNNASNNQFLRSTSALKYKTNVRDLESIDVSKFRPVRYNSLCEADDPNREHFGLIADEVDVVGIKELVTYGEDGAVEGFQYERLTVVLLKAIQEQQQMIETLQAEVAALKGA